MLMLFFYCKPITLWINREKYYTGIKSDSNLKVKLTGSWETMIGDNDLFGSTFLSEMRFVSLKRMFQCT